MLSELVTFTHEPVRRSCRSCSAGPEAAMDLSVPATTLVGAAARRRRAPPGSCCWPRRSTPRRSRCRSRSCFGAGPVAAARRPQIAGHAAGADRRLLVVDRAQQVVIGAALGFLVQVLFTAVQTAGDLIDVTGGFSLAGLRPAVDDQTRRLRQAPLPARDHPAVHQRRPPADRAGLRDVLHGSRWAATCRPTHLARGAAPRPSR